MSSTDADRTPAASACDPGAQVAGLVACVIPCFNEGLVLGETLASVLAAGVPPGDVLVIDDCSSDDTRLVAQRFQVRVLRNERNLGKSKSIARAIQVLRELGCHDFISILDADTLVDREYFAMVVQAFAGDPRWCSSAGSREAAGTTG